MYAEPGRTLRLGIKSFNDLPTYVYCGGNKYIWGGRFFNGKMAGDYVVYMRNIRGRRIPIAKGEVDSLVASGWEICSADDIEEYRPDRDQSLVSLDQQRRNQDEGDNAQELELLFV